LVGGEEGWGSLGGWCRGGVGGDEPGRIVRILVIGISQNIILIDMYLNNKHDSIIYIKILQSDPCPFTDPSDSSEPSAFKWGVSST
jgi:hypothetical protein